MEEYTETHPLRTKPHTVAQTGQKLRISVDQILHLIVIVPHGFWEEQFADAPEYVLVAGDARSEDYHDIVTEDMILIPFEPSCRSFIVWATRTEFRLQKAWVDTILAVVQYRVQLYFLKRACTEMMGCINAIALDNIAPSFVYQVCHDLFVLCSVFLLSLSNYLCAVSGLP
jgi:hypothetical protein